jgi:hypothetical protein
VLLAQTSLLFAARRGPANGRLLAAPYSRVRRATSAALELDVA